MLTLATAVLLAGCTDVGVDPESDASAENVFTDDSSYEAYLAKLYGGLNITGQQGPAGNGDIGGIDEGFSQYMRMYWSLQQLPTDEAIIAWQDDGIELLNTHTWDENNQFVRGMYDRIFFQVSQSNEFLRQTTTDLLEGRGNSQQVIEEMPQFRAEARFLRALSYWHGIDLFGNIPFVTQEFERGAEPPEQATREEVFNFVEDELLAITGEAGDTEEVLPPIGDAEYGRADRGAAYMLLAKLYQNAEVYIGESRSNDVAEYTSRIIDSGAYSLEEEYHNQFLADNEFSPEFIFAIPHDGERTQHFGGTTFLGNAALGGQADDFGLSGWFGLRTTSAVANRYDSDDTRPIFPNTAGDQFIQEGRSKEITDIADFGGGGGYIVPKYQNVTSQGEPGPNNTHSDVDYPVFRLADAYLMYAEAAVRGAGDLNRAASLVNELQERAGLPSDLTADDLTLEFILDERSRELLWEGHRRTDLIRFDQFTGTDLDWPWTQRENFSSEDFRKLFPLPGSELRANPTLEQNPGYSSAE
ncbi:MAG: RagB/SusD family nutrient uptake outer membrane protein [Longimonas sp.]|uniref:RagB/SusD family nutrient uptake outer membrane protein n=1 Tax=Longimonas sp. TaxID=2039626 RepID=UPI0039750060